MKKIIFLLIPVLIYLIIFTQKAFSNMEIDERGELCWTVCSLPASPVTEKNYLDPILASYHWKDLNYNYTVEATKDQNSTTIEFEKIKAIVISNVGPNSIVSYKNTEERITTPKVRDWKFFINDFSRQDLGVSIKDAVNGNNLTEQHSYFMFFPRIQTPTIRSSSDKQVVVLSNGEEVVFDTQSKVIIDGVLKENFPQVVTRDLSKIERRISYTGRGLMLQANAFGKDPRGVRHNYVYIKNGDQECRNKVKVGDLWVIDNDDFVHFRFPSDDGPDGFREYIHKRCGFAF